MNKDELIKMISEKAEISIGDAEAALEAFQSSEREKLEKSLEGLSRDEALIKITNDLFKINQRIKDLEKDINMQENT